LISEPWNRAAAAALSPARNIVGFHFCFVTGSFHAAIFYKTKKYSLRNNNREKKARQVAMICSLQKYFVRIPVIRSIRDRRIGVLARLLDFPQRSHVRRY
jgi:hypothetical protein